MKKALLVLTLGAFVASAGTAFAGVSYSSPSETPATSANVPITIAQETFTTNGTFTIPSGYNGSVHRALSLVPQSTGAYTIEVNVGTTIIAPADPTQNGVTWVPAAATTSVFADVSIEVDPNTGGAGCALVGQTLNVASATQYRWNTGFNASCVSPPTINVRFNDNFGGFVDINDGRPAGSGLDANVPIKMQVRFLDQATLTPFPSDNGVGNDTFNYIVSDFATSATVHATTATIDVGFPSARTNFLPGINDNDTLVIDRGAYVTVAYNASYYDWAGPRDAGFNPNGTTKGFYNFTMLPVVRTFEYVLPLRVGLGAHDTGTSFTTRSWSFSNAGSSNQGQKPIISEIDGTHQQAAGSFTVTVDYYRGTCAGANDTTCTAAGTKILLNSKLPSNVTYTTWNLNGTVLYSPFISGNTTAFMQRFYICAPLSQVDSPSFDVVITTVPVIGVTATTLEFPSWKGTVMTVLKAGGCINVRMEDLMTQFGIPQPYNTDGGNLAVEMTFPAPGVVGLHQTTNNPTLGQPSSFVTAPMIRLNRTVSSPFGPLLIDPGL